MSLGATIIREPGDELAASDRVVYRAFVSALGTQTSPERAILRAARRTGVSRRRVIEIIRNVNSGREV